MEDICSHLSRNFYFFFGRTLRQLNSLYTGPFFTSFAIVFVVAVVVLVETASVILSRGFHSLELTKLANIFKSTRHVRQEKEIIFPLTSYTYLHSDR